MSDIGEILSLPCEEFEEGMESLWEEIVSMINIPDPFLLMSCGDCDNE